MLTVDVGSGRLSERKCQSQDGYSLQYLLFIWTLFKVEFIGQVTSLDEVATCHSV